MVKIAYILTPIDFGGAEKVNVTFLKNVKRECYEMHLILLTRPWENNNTFIDFIKEEKFTITKIPVANKPPSEGKDYLRVARCIMYLYRTLSKGSFDIIHSHGYFADIVSLVACKLLGIPLISTCHGFIENDSNLRIYNMMDKFMLRYFDRILAVSTTIRNELVNNGVKSSKISVVQNAIECKYNKKELGQFRVEKRSLISINDNESLIGFVGRLSEEKGVNYLIEAAVMLKQISADFKLVIVGDGPKKSELICLANSKGLDQEVIFTGFQNDIEKWLPAFDVFVLPSLTEGTPMALLEAMSTGIPVIASAVGGVPNILENGINGFLVTPGNSNELCEKMALLLSDPILCELIAKEAEKTINEKFDVNRWCRKIEKEYDSLLQNDMRGIFSCG